MTPRILAYQNLIQRAVAWSLANQERIQAESDIQAHYKAPFFWYATGNAAMAGFYRKLMETRFLRSDGDFRTEEDFKGFRNFPCTVHNQYIYPNGWIIVGLQKAGAYDLARRGLDFVLRFQNPAHGGFYYAFDAKTKQIDTRLMDSSSTSSAGMALLACGRLKEAVGAGEFILRLIALQPEPDKHFFSCMTPEGKLHTDVFASEDQWDPNSRKQKCLATGSDGLNELTWLIGKPTKFLTKLYMATGDQRYLEGAKWAFRYFNKLQPNALVNFASCKTMWVGTELFRITGDRTYLDTACRLGDYYAQSQQPSGAWVHTLWYKTEAEQAFTWTSDLAHEYGAEFADVLYDLGHAGAAN